MEDNHVNFHPDSGHGFLCPAVVSSGLSQEPEDVACCCDDARIYWSCSFPGIGNDKSWNVSFVHDTCQKTSFHCNKVSECYFAFFCQNWQSLKNLGASFAVNKLESSRYSSAWIHGNFGSFDSYLKMTHRSGALYPGPSPVRASLKPRDYFTTFQILMQLCTFLYHLQSAL